MFLNRDEIISALESERLIVDPVPEDARIGPLTIPLRVGTKFLRIGTESATSMTIQASAGEDVIPDLPTTEPHSVEFGEAIDLSPGSSLIITTLEVLGMGQELVGLLSLRSSLSRLGLTGNTPLIHPHYRGNITFRVSNLGEYVIRISPGTQLLELALAQFSGDPSSLITKFEGSVSELDERGENPEIEKPSSLPDQEQQSRSASASTRRTELRELLNSALNAEEGEKGKALEDFSFKAFQEADGLNVIDRNVRGAAEEIDILIKNNLQSTNFWRSVAGSPIIIECKNWSRSVGAKEISVLFDKLKSIGPDARTGILIAPNGISGDDSGRRDAFRKIREKRQKGKYIIVLELENLEYIADGVNVAKEIQERYENMNLTI